MKDTVITGNGKSKIVKAPSDMPDTFAAWRTQLLAGAAYLDIALNTELEGDNIGVDVIGTPINKANMLTDTTAAALGLGSDPSLNDALGAVAKKSVEYSGVLDKDDWVGTSAPYTQEITVTGITSSDKPLVSLVLSSTYATAVLEQEAWASALKIETGTNSITATFIDKPTIDLNILLKVVG